MPSIYQLKPAFQQLLRPLVRRLFKIGVTANQVTVLAALISILLGALVGCFASHSWIFAALPVWMLLRMTLNAIDGMLAREFDQQSTVGAYLNELGDIVADIALVVPFALIPGVSSFAVFTVISLAIVSEYSGVLGPMVGASRRYDGPMGKSDRAFAISLLCIGIALGWIAGVWIDAALILVSLLLIHTSINRVRMGLKEAQEQAAKA